MSKDALRKMKMSVLLEKFACDVTNTYSSHHLREDLAAEIDRRERFVNDRLSQLEGYVADPPVPVETRDRGRCKCGHEDYNHSSFERSDWCSCDCYTIPEAALLAPPAVDDAGWTTLGELRPGEAFEEERGARWWLVRIDSATGQRWCREFPSSSIPQEKWIGRDTRVRRLLTVRDDAQTLERVTKVLEESCGPGSHIEYRNIARTILDTLRNGGESE